MTAGRGSALVTGSAGFVGRHMTAALRSRGWSVTEWDLPDCDAVEMFRRDAGRYDLVVHLAYIVGGRKSIDGSKGNLARNLALDAALFDWTTRNGKPRILYFSSSAAYPVEMQKKGWSVPLVEASVGAGVPDVDYGWAKLTGERMAANYAAQGGVVHVVRPFSGYGADQSLDYPFPSFAERARRRADPFEVWGDPTSRRDWIHIDDVVAGSLAVVEADCREPVNICTGRGVSMEELAGVFMAEAGYSAPVVTVPGSPYGVHTRVGDPRKFFDIYKPKIDLEEGVRLAMRGPS